MSKASDPEKFCQTCGRQYWRKRFNGRLEDLTRFKQRKYCSLSCGNTRKVVGYHGLSCRARQYLKNACENCEGSFMLAAHHIDGVRTNNVETNVQTLCVVCHALFHHGKMESLECRRALATASIVSGQ